MNKKGFFKKHWWAFTIAVAVAVVGGVTAFSSNAAAPYKVTVINLMTGASTNQYDTDAAGAIDDTDTDQVPAELKTDIDAGKAHAFVKADNTLKGFNVATLTVEADSEIYYVTDTDFEALKLDDKAGTTAGVNWVIADDPITNAKDVLYVFGDGSAAGVDFNVAGTDVLVGNYKGNIYPGPATEPFKIDEAFLDEAGVAIYGDGGATWGVSPSGVGNEIDAIGSGQFYESFTKPAVYDAIAENVDIRGVTEFNSNVIDVPSKLNVGDAAGSLPWKDATVSEVQTVYMGNDVNLKGNVSFLFNGTSQSNWPYFIDTNGNGELDAGETSYDGAVKESAYTALKDIYFYSKTTDVTCASGMFARCPSLENIYRNNLADFNNCFVTSYMFFGDDNLQNGEGSFVDKIDLSTNTVLRDTSYMFAGAKNIVEPNVKNYKMNNVTMAEGMFLGARNAALSFTDNTKDSYVGDWVVSALVDAALMFDGRTINAGEIMADMETSRVKNFGNINPGFGELVDGSNGNVVTGLVDLSKWNCDELVGAQYMFAQNDGITGVTFGTNYPKLEDISEMFLRCDNLNNVTGTAVDVPALKYAQYTFMGCGKNGGDVVLKLTAAAPKLENIAFMFYHTGFGTVNLGGSTALDALKIAPAAFADMPNVTSINLADQTFPNLSEAQYMFFNDPKLATLDTSGWTMADAKNLSFMFMNDVALAELDLSHWQAGTVPCTMENFLYNTGVGTVSLANMGNQLTNMSLAFARNGRLASATLPASLENMTNAFGMFSNCQNLATITPGAAVVAPSKAVDMRGMFCSDAKLTGTGVAKMGYLIGGDTTDTSFMFKDCPLITSVDLSGADTRNVVYMQGMFEGNKALTTVTMGGRSTPDSALDIGAMFRNCALTEASAQAIIDHMATSANVIDMYETFKNNKAPKKLDFSDMDFTNVKDMTGFCDGCDALGVIKEEEASEVPSDLIEARITLPANFGTSLLTTAGKNVRLFYVDKSGETVLNPAEQGDDVLTYLNIKGTSMPGFLARYNWSADNRKFAVVGDQKINGKKANTYNFTDGNDATLLFDVLPTITIDGTPATIKYEWSDVTDAANPEDLAETTKEYLAKASAYGDGAAHVIASTAYPDVFKATTAKDYVDPVRANFLLNANVESTTAIYVGDEVPVGSKYDKDDVIVTATLTSGKTIEIPSTLWTPSDTEVKKTGPNNYTATYDGKKANFIVTGKRAIGSIVTKYVGPSVLVGDSWDKANVETTAYYADDVNKTAGFLVTPTYYSGYKVSKVGANTYTATYEDPEQGGKAFTSQFNVPGYKEIGYLEAEYKGPAIEIGEDYKKTDVLVKAHYADGSGMSVLGPDDWTADSKTVTGLGDNSFIATYRDPFGSSFTAGYTVKGIEKSEKSSSSSSSSSTPTSEPTSQTPADPPADITDTYKGYDPNSPDTTPTNQTAISTVDVPSPNRTVANNTDVRQSTGNVQTGTENRMPFYILLLCLFVGVGVSALVIMTRMKKDKNRNRNN